MLVYVTADVDIPAHALDDEEPLAACYRHPDRETALSCIDCERPICTDCARTAAVGLKCPECAKVPRTALARIPQGKLVVAVVAGVVASLVAGVVHAMVLSGFLGIIFAFLLGSGIGEIMRRAAGGFRDRQLARAAAACAFLGFLAPAVPDLLGAAPKAIHATNVVYLLVYAVAAAIAAYQRTE